MLEKKKVHSTAGLDVAGRRSARERAYLISSTYEAAEPLEAAPRAPTSVGEQPIERVIVAITCKSDHMVRPSNTPLTVRWGLSPQVEYSNTLCQ